MTWWILVLAACGSKTSPTVENRAAPTAQVERGLNFERGRGVPRDYRKAIEVYRAACQEGCGELASCRRLLRLASEERGVMMPGKELITLVGHMCDRHETNACITAMLLGLRGEEAVPHVDDKDKLLEMCEGGDLGACQLTMFGASFNFGGSSTVESRQQRAAQKACVLGDPDGCNTVAKHWYYQCEDKELTACIDETTAEWRTGMGSDAEGLRAFDREIAGLREVATRAIAACNDGDRDACDAIGHEIPPAQLCDAGDFSVCRKLATAGDAHARQVACAAGVEAKCDVTAPAAPDARAVSQLLRMARQECEKEHNQQMCDLLAKETALPRCP